MNKLKQETVTIDKLVFGGQGLAHLNDGRPVFVWNALPGEKVLIQITKSKKNYCEAIAIDVFRASDYRRSPKDEAYLSTSPWQILDFQAENKYKSEILEEIYKSNKIEIPKQINFDSDGVEWNYRNKMEYGFWADDSGLQLALFRRGSKGKIIIRDSSIARAEINKVALKTVEILNQHKVRGSQLKTIILRSNSKSQVIAGLFVKDEFFPEIDDLASVCSGFRVFYSSPKSPASIVSKELYSYGDQTIVESIIDKEFSFAVNSFFQVNIGIFERALRDIKTFVDDDKEVVDMYSGVGAIGLSVGADYLIESEPENIKFAKLNKLANRGNQKSPKIVSASAESSLDYIKPSNCLIVDPPRAGLHIKVIDRIIESHPKKIIYLSCNPVTQARDIKLLSDNYKITFIKGYNFFPKTPHIESLALLEAS